MKRFGILFITYLILFNCSVPKVQVNPDMDFRDTEKSYSVLNLEYQGLNLSSKIADTAADRLSTQLYVNNKLAIVDRSMVKAALSKLNIKNSGKISREELTKLANLLNTDYVILGKLVSNSTIDIYEGSPKGKISLSLRILDTESGQVQAMAYYSVSSKNSPSKAIEKLISGISSKLARHKKKKLPLVQPDSLLQDSTAISIKESNDN